jgi:hypothetical protein
MQSSTARSNVVIAAPWAQPSSLDPSSRHREAIRRIRADYSEMPGLSVTVEQGARLWHVERAVCQEALGHLAREGFVFCAGRMYRRT